MNGVERLRVSDALLRVLDTKLLSEVFEWLLFIMTNTKSLGGLIRKYDSKTIR